MVRAGLQRDHGSAALDGCATRLCVLQSHDLGMRPARLLREAFADHPTVAVQQAAAHARVGVAQTNGVCQRQRPGMALAFIGQEHGAFERHGPQCSALIVQPRVWLITASGLAAALWS